MNPTEGLSASDVALLAGNNNDAFGNGGWGGMIWLFAILALMGGGFGGWGNNGNMGTAIQADVNRGFDNQNLQAQTRDILSAVTAGTAQNVAAVNQSYHDITGFIGDKYNELQRDVAALAVGQANLIANQNECCCNNRMLMSEIGNNIGAAIAQARYENAMNTAAINANTTAQTQRIIDMMTGNTIQDLRDQVQNLQLANQLNGVVRYPNGWTYNAGNNPFCNNGCGINM